MKHTVNVMKYTLMTTGLAAAFGVIAYFTQGYERLTNEFWIYSTFWWLVVAGIAADVLRCTAILPICRRWLCERLPRVRILCEPAPDEVPSP